MSVFRSVVRRHCYCSVVAVRIRNFSANSSSAAENFLTHLQEGAAQIEKNLDTVKTKLDARCVAQVLERCAIDKPQLGLRFFVWAALRPTHRHTSFMYEKACKSLGIDRNPRIIIDVMDKYRDEGLAVSLKMLKVVLNLCKSAKDDNLGMLVLRKMKEFNCRPDTVSYNVVIRLLVEKGRMDEAMALMTEMGLIDLYPDMITYVSIIKGLCDAGRLKDSVSLIRDMKMQGCPPNSVVYSSLLDGICRHKSLETALEFLDTMEKENGSCKPNVVTYTTMIKGFVEKGRASEAVTILDKMYDSGHKPNRVAFVSLLDGLCREDRLDEARRVVDKYGGGEFPYDDLYSLLVVSVLRSGNPKESESMIRSMIARGLRPSGLASSHVVRNLVSEGRVVDAFSLLDALEKSGNLAHVDGGVYSTLLAELCRKNNFADAEKVVGVMVEGRIFVKSCLAASIIEHLDSSGECDLASEVSKIVR
ncbi:pentatricopeptide repeat-containing protein At5g47360-like [Andrographis paniculata]|uniref:pentatricopeptide repeat-containing protein At5g47360-like n=1 Tax=Andrographis paniculata TaxID=175694 RepID=UPI0021E8D19B|nr:pentatricopeptide repeat-containing protein At5g47360-like [Andrographis paniculata]